MNARHAAPKIATRPTATRTGDRAAPFPRSGPFGASWRFCAAGSVIGGWMILVLAGHAPCAGRYSGSMPGPISSLMQAMHGPIYRSRLAELVGRIVPHLTEGDRVLDLGCGNGTLGRALMDAPNCPKGVVVEGLERVARGGEPIKVHAYAGGRMPFDDGAFDAVI